MIMIAARHGSFSGLLRAAFIAFIAGAAGSTVPMAMVAADAEALPQAVLKPFYSDLRILFQQYYPKVTSHLVKDKIHFEQDTRVFIVHEAYKTGEWQDPWETRGPKRGGILCEIELKKGKYEGAAVVPQTFDKRYFKVLLLAPYSARQDAHLYVHLSYPADVNSEFLRLFTERINEFGK